MIRPALLVVLSLVVQRALSSPGLPSWPSEVIFPAVWIVAPPLRRHEPRWPYLALLIGIGWDLLMEPVVGPGGIAWSAAALGLYGIAGVVADRSPRAWAALGAAGAVILVLVRQIALLPLGLASFPTMELLFRTVVLTGAWCGLVGGVLALDLPARWRSYRVRTLR
ncbi:MAG: hypothetical protein ACC742_00215 [Thermoanaerobaculales bacterium]